MDGKLWRELYAKVVELSDSSRAKYEQFSDREIVIWFLWSVVNDRPLCWACCPQNAPTEMGFRRCPSPATMSRRLRSARVLELLAQIECFLTRPQIHCICKFIDAKPLPVGHCSKDPDARCGHAGKGYRIYVVTDKNNVIYGWQVRPNNVSEVEMATQLIGSLQGVGYLVGDGAYDANKLYELAKQKQHQLIAPRAKPGAGFGHRKNSLARFRSCAILERDRWIDNGFGKELIYARTQIERFFGNLTSFAGGLGPLPAWVRTLTRVERWVRAKLIINAIRISLLSRLTSSIK